MQKIRKSLGGDVEQFTVNMKEENHLSALKKSIAVFIPAMTTFQREHHAYKFQIAVTVIFHNFIEVYEHNESDWVFSNFASLPLWHIDPLRASVCASASASSRQTRTSESYEHI